MTSPWREGYKREPPFLRPTDCDEPCFKSRIFEVSDDQGLGVADGMLDLGYRKTVLLALLSIAGIPVEAIRRHGHAG